MVHIGINAHLLSNRPGYRTAGIHNVLHQLLVHLPEVASADWHFTAMVGRGNPAVYEGVDMQQASLDTTPASKRILWEQAIQPFALDSFDLYHAGAFVAPVLLNKPMVVTVYDLTFMRYPQRLTTGRRLYLRTFTEMTCKRARRILAISESTKHDLVELLGIPAEKVDVTPLGYDDIYQPLPEDAVTRFRAENNLPERFWLYLGTLEPRKNLVTLIEAYAQLPANERLPLVLAGGKGWMSEPIFEAIARHGLEDTIALPGFIPTEALPLWYNSAECFIFPSVFEGFGLPVLEAMACGTPIITSNVSSLPEVAGEAGMTLPPHELDAWVSGLRQAFHDESWRNEAREAGLVQAKKFNWDTTARLTVASYERALEVSLPLP
ncbi:MAG: glycosyltransferase family 1 protein [Chloroflexota bacterium]